MREDSPICSKPQEANEEDDDPFEESAFAEEEAKQVHEDYPKEFGSVTEFYFMLMEGLHIFLGPIIKRCEEVTKMSENLMEEKKRMAASHPEYNQLIEQLELVRGYRMAYEIVLSDQALLRSVFNFYDINFGKLLEWGDYNPQEYKLCDTPVKDNM